MLERISDYISNYMPAGTDIWKEFIVSLIISVIWVLALRLNPKFKRMMMRLSPRLKLMVIHLGKTTWEKRFSILAAFLGTAIVIGAISQPAHSQTLALAAKRNEIRCGININTPGMGHLTSSEILENLEGEDFVSQEEIINEVLTRNDVEGLDVDFCRAVSAAVFGDDKHWKPIYLTEDNRFSSIREGTVDVVFRNTSWTSERDIDEQVDFGPPNFYDQLAIVVKNDGLGPDPDKREILDGQEVCIARGENAYTTSFTNMDIYKKQLAQEDNIHIKLKTFRDNGEPIKETGDALDAFFAERGCTAVASDGSQILASLYNRPDRENYLIWGDDVNEYIAAELLSPILPENDEVWKSLVSHVIYTTIRAEELELSKRNVGAAYNADEPSPSVKKFLHPDVSQNFWESFWEKLALPKNESPTLSIIKTVGNYGEIYERNLGEIYSVYGDSRRGPNSLLKYNGALVSPPF